MRINKFLAQAGRCSRRQADFLISAKKVKINERLAVLGDQVESSDKVFLNGKQVFLNQEKTYLVFNKPVGVICTTNTNAKDNIIEYINCPKRVFPIGRLDVKSEGLIFLTNDGAIVDLLMKGENKVEKEYIVDVDKTITDDFINKQQNPFYIDKRKTIPAKVSKVGDKSYKIILVEGIKRQIRRMAEKYGYNVVKLKRIRIGNILLGDLKTGQWHEIPEREFKEKLGLS
jgi:23S rRNA pseudouridine2604 synthase